MIWPNTAYVYDTIITLTMHTPRTLNTNSIILFPLNCLGTGSTIVNYVRGHFQSRKDESEFDRARFRMTIVTCDHADRIENVLTCFIEFPAPFFSKPSID